MESPRATMPTEPLILLVDDDLIGRTLHWFLLAKCAHATTVQIATDGLEALHALQTRGNQPTLVLLDLHMPNMGGFEFLDKYLALPVAQRSQTQIVVLSSSECPAELERVRKLGLRFVEKPLKMPLIMELLQSFVHEYGQHLTS